MNYVEQLKSILVAAHWSQEQLAHELGVSFATVNAWVNNRAVPRAKALANINSLYLRIVGAEQIDEYILSVTKNAALNLKLDLRKLLQDTPLVDKLSLFLTYHTNTIEGSTMTLADVSDVIFDHSVLSNRTAIEKAEARNHQAALHWLLDKLANDGKGFVINERLVLDLHTRLMNGIISDAGKYRMHTVRIMGSHVPLANWQKIPSLMAEFTNTTEQEYSDVVALLAHTHAVFEKIHPFSDGNGRTGRLLLVAQALQAGLTPPIVVKERKQAYYKYLERAQTADQYQALELFMAESIIFCQELLYGEANS